MLINVVLIKNNMIPKMCYLKNLKNRARNGAHLLVSKSMELCPYTPCCHFHLLQQLSTSAILAR